MTLLSAKNNNKNDFRRGIDLFNRAHFFDAHEVLEDVWRSLPQDWPRGRSPQQDLRRHVQGVVQLAVAFHHESRHNHVGARSVLERALRNLNGADSSFPDLDLDRLRSDMADWLQHLSGLRPRPADPQICERKPTR
jgi:predicted metal-dependent hydrolase